MTPFFLPANFAHWFKIIGKFVSVQIFVQALSLASGIFLVRTLEQQQYAYFTIANTMQATMNLLADTGIRMSLSAKGGQVWQDRYRFGQLINTAMKLRYSLAAISITVVTPILIWMLLRNGASVAYTVLITIVVLLGLSSQLTTGVLMVVPHLHSQISRVRNLDLLSAIFRLILLGIGYLTFWNAGIAIASVSVVAFFQRAILGSWVSEKIDTDAPVNEEDRKFIIGTITNVLPNSIFFCIQGQLSIFLISIFGSTENIAEIGALGRLAVVFTILNSVMNAIVLPSFSRCQSFATLRKRYFHILSLFLLFGLLLIVISVVFPRELLWILGGKYSHLTNELTLMMILTVTNYLVGLMSSLNFSKAWVQQVWIEIPLRIALQVFLLIWLDISTIQGVILLGLFSNIAPFIVNAMLTYRGLMNFKLNESKS